MKKLAQAMAVVAALSIGARVGAAPAQPQPAPKTSAPAAAKSSAPAAPPGTGTGQTVRQITFPDKWALGKIYSIDVSEGSMMPHSKEVSKKGKFINTAQGKVSIPVNKNTRVYLMSSFRLCDEPDVIKTLPPNSFDCIVLGVNSVFLTLDKMIANLPHLSGLKRLEFKGAEMTDEELKPLSTMPGLTSLNISGCNIKGTCLKDLATTAKLEDLDISHNPLDRSVFTVISQFKNLRQLHIGRCGANDACLADISKLSKLQYLSISQSPITRAGLAQLVALKNLQELDISGNSLSVADLESLRGASMKILCLPRTKYTDAELKTLQKWFPTTQLQHQEKKVDEETKTIFAPLH